MRSHFSCKQPLLSMCLRFSITLRLAPILDFLVRVSRRAAWNHMTANNLGTVCSLFPSTACLSSIKPTTWSPPWLKTNWEGRGQPKRIYALTPLLDLSLHTTSYNTGRNQLYSCRAYHSISTAVDAHCWEIRHFWSEDRHIRSFRIHVMHVTWQNRLNLGNAFLIPCTSF